MKTDRTGWNNAWLGLVALFSGAALLASIFFKLPLWITLTCSLGFAACIASHRWRNTPVSQRPMLRRRVVVGVVAGVLATLAYDFSRLALVSIAGWAFWPFETFVIFGLATRPFFLFPTSSPLSQYLTAM